MAESFYQQMCQKAYQLSREALMLDPRSRALPAKLARRRWSRSTSYLAEPFASENPARLLASQDPRIPGALWRGFLAAPYAAHRLPALRQSPLCAQQRVLCAGAERETWLRLVDEAYDDPPLFLTLPDIVGNAARAPSSCSTSTGIGATACGSRWSCRMASSA